MRKVKCACCGNQITVGHEVGDNKFFRCLDCRFAQTSYTLEKFGVHVDWPNPKGGGFTEAQVRAVERMAEAMHTFLLKEEMKSGK